ncbi:helix-turn-helix domain-containing protein [Teredinibacter sp. KSP-S5-2]|uniref:MarR family winged helix-turn-helix transcriptional regulator n=1 Tax=Teredinibacter sp. KSP-S5-2 TaxID=3034506 RepID=UPI002934CBC5|nr:helix-turn-helix domain-containing protein [Teredinibacter sp. KSP-S5-2]WNO08577.1 helix-turn-helix domain-containing protein [Teredinibacter sp. KSP-S5-2]
MTSNLYSIIERLSNLLRSESRSQGQDLGLQPVQHEALHYISRCNRYSDTPQGVTEYLGLTKGTVSQTLKVLESRGLIEKKKDSADKRITHLQITAAGSSYLTSTTPPGDFLKAVERLGQEKVTVLNELLCELLKAYQTLQGREGFGVCKQCKFNQRRKDGFFCELTRESLSSEDIRLICKEFTKTIST